MNTLHERLKEERLRLELNQEAMAKLGGVKRRAQINYESGNRCPDGRYLAAIAAAGADVQYILTGVRSMHKGDNSQRTTVKSASDAHINAYPQRLFTENEQSVAQERAEYGKPVLSPREAALLDNYRHCTDEGDKNAIERMALLAARAGKFKEKKSGAGE